MGVYDSSRPKYIEGVAFATIELAQNGADKSSNRIDCVGSVQTIVEGIELTLEATTGRPQYHAIAR